MRFIRVKKAENIKAPAIIRINCTQRKCKHYYFIKDNNDPYNTHDDWDFEGKSIKFSLECKLKLDTHFLSKEYLIEHKVEILTTKLSRLLYNN